MTPERTRAIRLGVAGQNLFDIAFAYELRAARNVTDDAINNDQMEAFLGEINET